MDCPKCGADLQQCHILEDRYVAPMKNKSRIIAPTCARCGRLIQTLDVLDNIVDHRKVLLLSGTAGTGKTALGQLIERRCGYVFIDGDAMQKRVHHRAMSDPALRVDEHAFHSETIATMLALLGLGYHVVVGYVIDEKRLATYVSALKHFGIAPVFRVLVPERSVCLERDLARECWTAGETWVDKWHEPMRSFLYTKPWACIDNSRESLEETFRRFVDIV